MITKLVITSLDKVITIRNEKDYNRLISQYPMIDYDHNMMVTGLSYAMLINDQVDAIRVPKRNRELIDQAPEKFGKYTKGKWCYLIFNKNLIKIKEEE